MNFSFRKAKFNEKEKKGALYFIRGLWAENGCVYLEKGFMLRAKIVIGSIDLITDVERVLNINGLSKRNISTSSHSKYPSYSFRNNSIEDQRKLFDFLCHRHYKDSIEQWQYEQYKSYFLSNSNSVNCPANKNCKAPEDPKINRGFRGLAVVPPAPMPRRMIGWNSRCICLQ